VRPPGVADEREADQQEKDDKGRTKGAHA
jgi:hypothetical protein